MTKSISFSQWIAVGLLGLVLAVPLLAIGSEVFEVKADNWEHFSRYLLSDYIIETGWFGGLVVVLSLCWGFPTAYLVARYDFFGRSFWRWALVVPLAMPGYIVAYCYASLSFDSIVNLWGCSLVMSLVLYPYIYLSVKAELETQSLPLLEAGQMLGVKDWEVFWRVVLPLVRPSAFVGAALVAMEALNEYGAVKHFGVNTLTPGLFRAWNAMDDRGVAARLAVMLLFFTLLLVAFEKWQRRNLRYFSSKPKPISRIKAGGLQTIVIWLVCWLPFFLGFVLPFGILFSLSLRAVVPMNLVQSLLTSLLMAAVGAFLTAFFSLLLSGQKRLSLLLLAGYAVPGAVLAMGIVVFFSRLEKYLPFLLSGSYLALLYGYVVRFLSVGFAPIEAARLKINPALEESAWMLGKTKWQAKKLVVYPLLHKSFWAAVVLLFVEIFKELPMTLVLRPFGFHSLATRAFELATDEQLAQAAIPSIMIAVVGVFPIIWLVRQSEK